MKNSLFIVLFAVAMLALPYFSCSSAPPAAEEPPAAPAQPAEPPSQASQALLDELNAAIAQAEAARKRAGDFDGNAYFPSEWEAAERQLANARALPKTTDTDVKGAISAFNTLVNTYDSIFNAAVPLYAQAKEDEITALWEQLVEAGARDFFPEYFVPADETAVSAYDQYEKGDYYAAKDTADLVLLMYQTLAVVYDAWMAREETIEWDFVRYGEDDFDAADGIIIAAMDSYEADDIPAAFEKAEEALLLYVKVLNAGWRAYAEQRSALAMAEREAALEVKANIATRDLFTEADSSYKSANDLFGAQHYKESAEQFVNAETQFIIASNSTLEKRRNAEVAISEAHEKINESDETARQAEIILEGGAE